MRWCYSYARAPVRPHRGSGHDADAGCWPECGLVVNAVFIITGKLKTATQVTAAMLARLMEGGSPLVMKLGVVKEPCQMVSNSGEYARIGGYYGTPRS
jgi:hypothetical protein